VFKNSLFDLGVTLYVGAAANWILRRFFINESDLSSLQNKHHVVDHQGFLKDN
jgi:hypothetical protein